MKVASLVLYHYDGPPNLKLVLMVLADNADDFGENSFPSYKRIASLTGCSERTAMRRVAELIDLGFVEISKPGGRVLDPGSGKHLNLANIFRVRIDALEALPDLRPAKCKVTGDPRLRGVTGDTPSGFSEDSDALTCAFAVESHRGVTGDTPNGFSTVSPVDSARNVTPRGVTGDSALSTTGVTQLCHPNRPVNHPIQPSVIEPVDNSAEAERARRAVLACFGLDSDGVADVTARGQDRAESASSATPVDTGAVEATARSVGAASFGGGPTDGVAGDTIEAAS
jgi:hypothetical protein